MHNHNRFLPIFLLSLALAAPTVLPGAAPAEALVKDKAQKPKDQDKDKAKQNRQNDDWYDDRYNDDRDEDEAARFRGMDSNRDGRVTRSEWRGNDRSFDQHDWNDDGVLSGEELRPSSWGTRNQPRTQDDDDRRNDRFERLDRNNDGYLSASEWPREERRFDRLDLNNDGRVSRSEFQDRDFDRRDTLAERFAEMDTNRDGRLSRNAWTHGEDAFERLDRNNDQYISRDELLNRDWNDQDDLYPRNESRFRDLDQNRDSRLSRNEWTGSRDFFDRMDRNDDGYLSLNEWLGR